MINLLELLDISIVFGRLGGRKGSYPALTSPYLKKEPKQILIMMMMRES